MKLWALVSLSVLFSPICQADPVVLYSGTFASGVFRSVDGGVTWINSGSTATLPSPIYGLVADPNSPGTVYAGGIGIFKSADAGTTWTLVTPDPIQPFVLALAIDPVNSAMVYAATLVNGVLQSNDAGATWHSAGLASGTVNVVVVDPKNSNLVYAGGPLGLFKSVDAGKSFTQVVGLAQVNSIAFDQKDSRITFVAANSGVYKTTDSGSSWSLLNCPCGGPGAIVGAIAVDPVNPSIVYAGGSNPALNAFMARSADSGATWTQINDGLNSQQVQTLWVSPQTGAVMAGTQGSNGLFRTNNQGAAWNVVASGLPDGVEVLSLVSSGSGVPAITSVVNAASFLPVIQNNSWITISGAGLSATTRTWNPPVEIINGLLPVALDGVSATVNDKPAAIYYISPGQINALTPVDTVIGPVNVVVRYGNVSSPAFVAQMQREAPAFFRFDPQNGRYAAAIMPDGTRLGPPGLFGPALPTAAAKPGDIVILFGTGCGPTDPPLPSESIFPGAALLLDRISITIGGLPVSVQFAGMSAPGICQFNAVVPQAPDGDQKLVAVIGGVQTQDNVFVYIQH